MIRMAIRLAYASYVSTRYNPRLENAIDAVGRRRVNRVWLSSSIVRTLTGKNTYEVFAEWMKKV